MKWGGEWYIKKWLSMANRVREQKFPHFGIPPIKRGRLLSARMLKGKSKSLGCHGALSQAATHKTNKMQENVNQSVFPDIFRLECFRIFRQRALGK